MKRRELTLPIQVNSESRIEKKHIILLKYNNTTKSK